MLRPFQMYCNFYFAYSGSTYASMPFTSHCVNDDRATHVPQTGHMWATCQFCPLQLCDRQPMGPYSSVAQLCEAGIAC